MPGELQALLNEEEKQNIMMLQNKNRKCSSNNINLPSNKFIIWSKHIFAILNKETIVVDTNKSCFVPFVINIAMLQEEVVVAPWLDATSWGSIPAADNFY